MKKLLAGKQHIIVLALSGILGVCIMFAALGYIGEGIFSRISLFSEIPKASGKQNSGYSTGSMICDPETRAAILMYHYVRPKAYDDPESIPGRLSVTPEIFHTQMTDLLKMKDEGKIDFMRTSDLIRWRNENLCPSESKNFVILTSDDGWKDSATDISPAAKYFHIPFSYSLISGKIEKANGAKTGFVNENDVSHMLSDGAEILSHSVNHEDFRMLSDTGTHAEICDSKKDLEQHFALPVRIFVYPAGHMNFFNDSILKECGYDFAFTTREGVVNKELLLKDPYTLPRLRIDAKLHLPSLLEEWLNGSKITSKNERNTVKLRKL